MEIDKNELQLLMVLASKAIKAIKCEPDYKKNSTLKEYAVLYNNFIAAVNNNDITKIESGFYRLSSLSRAFLETSSDWRKPCLDSIYDFESFGKKVFRY